MALIAAKLEAYAFELCRLYDTEIIELRRDQVEEEMVFDAQLIARYYKIVRAIRINRLQFDIKNAINWP